MIAKDLREDLNKKEKAQANIIDLEYALKAERNVLNLGTQTHALLRQVEDIKKKAGINNLWKHQEDKRLNEHFKKHPEDVGTLHITENSMTFDFSNKKKMSKLSFLDPFIIQSGTLTKNNLVPAVKLFKVILKNLWILK